MARRIFNNNESKKTLSVPAVCEKTTTELRLPADTGAYALLIWAWAMSKVLLSVPVWMRSNRNTRACQLLHRGALTDTKTSHLARCGREGHHQRWASTIRARYLLQPNFENSTSKLQKEKLKQTHEPEKQVGEERKQQLYIYNNVSEWNKSLNYVYGAGTFILTIGQFQQFCY